MFQCPSCKTQYDDVPPFCGVCGTRNTGAVATSDPLLGHVIDGRYRIIDLIGRGGMGAVYRVEHVKMGKIMAMKILHGDLAPESGLAKRFRREAEAVSRLSHLNTVSVFDFGSDGELMFLVMEYIDGRDLADVIRREGPLSLERTCRVLIQVCSGLMEAHSKGIVHRDLKPENILLCCLAEQQDFVKVVDFGLAKLRDFNERTRITAQGSLVGTPFYMAPEHCRGDAVDARSDIYALGAVMFTMLTGETPYSGDTAMAIITKHLTQPVPPPSKRRPEARIHPLGDDVVVKAMAKDPVQRYQSVEEMRRALADVLEQISPGSDFRRFSSAQDPLADISSAAFEETLARTRPGVEPGRGGQPVTEIKAPPGVRDSAPLSKSVIIGAREIGIGTRADFDHFERAIRRRRVVLWSMAATILVLALAAAGTFLYFEMRDNSDPQHETEPNDVPARADRLSPGLVLSGRLLSTAGVEDLDWYRLVGPEAGPWAVEVEIGAVPGLDVALQLMMPGRAEPLATENRNGPGAGEHILPTVVESSDLYVLVQEVRPTGAVPGRFEQPYGLSYKALQAQAFEREPNDAAAQASPVQLGGLMLGHFSSASDTDWFCTPSGQPVTSIQVSGIPGADIALDLVSGVSNVRTQVNAAGIGAGETTSVPAGTKGVCVGISQIVAAPPAPYQIIVK